MDLKFKFDPSIINTDRFLRDTEFKIGYACASIMLGQMRDARVQLDTDLLLIYLQDHNLLEDDILSRDKAQLILDSYRPRLLQYYLDQFTTKLSVLLKLWTMMAGAGYKRFNGIYHGGVIPVGARSIFENFLKIPAFTKMSNGEEMISDTLSELRYSFKLMTLDRRHISNNSMFDELSATDIQEFFDVLRICIQWVCDRVQNKNSWIKTTLPEAVQYYSTKLVDLVELAIFILSSQFCRKYLGMNQYEILESTLAYVNNVQREFNRDYPDFYRCNLHILKYSATYSHLPIGHVISMVPGKHYKVSKNTRPDYRTQVAQFMSAALLLAGCHGSWATCESKKMFINN